MSHYNLCNRTTSSDVIPGEFIHSEDSINPATLTTGPGENKPNQPEATGLIEEATEMGKPMVESETDTGTLDANNEHRDDDDSVIQGQNDFSQSQVNIDNTFGDISGSPLTQIKSDSESEYDFDDIYGYPNTTREYLPINDVDDLNELTQEQLSAIELAVAGMSPEQAKAYRKRHKMDLLQNKDKGEGTSSGKGKAVDGRNWGAAGIPLEELDPDVQNRELAKIERDRFRKDKNVHKRKDKEKKKHDNTRHRSVSVPLSESMQKSIRDTIRSNDKYSSLKKAKPVKEKRGEKSLRPTNQIDPRSYLGRAFEGIKPRNKKSNIRFTSEDSSNSSESESSDTESRKGRASNPSDDSSSTKSSDKSESSSSSSNSDSSTTSSSSSSSSDSSPDDNAIDDISIITDTVEDEKRNPY
ncbi:hypothetical protein NP233_g11421 [Leucocoprinus birnbaumii]|uniref:Uncharacterized protein n=1 Tax=Leucocoprinus birnbaumii TaxID=56174 RepID=A0AAD5VGL5_9AGAR|nr:hypothetical protein NP233_g11421 [Leucocoprinus birnbaumii]